MEEIFCLDSKNSGMQGKTPRSMITGDTYAPYKIIVGTQGNEILEYQMNPGKKEKIFENCC